MENKRKIIAIDLDETVNNLIEVLLNMYNIKYGKNIKFTDIKDYDVSKYFTECDNVFKQFPYAMNLLSFQPNAKYVLHELAKEYDIYFLTAGFPETMQIRDKWLSDNLKFYESRMLVMCRDKFLFNCDILVDDCFDNIEKHRLHLHDNLNKTYILFNRPWNKKYDIKNSPDITRVDNWNDIYKELLGNNLREVKRKIGEFNEK